MTILLIIAFFLMLIFIGLWFYRDRLYLKQNLEDVLSDELKKELNFKQGESVFEKNLKNISKKERMSLKIANEWDEDTES